MLNDLRSRLRPELTIERYALSLFPALYLPSREMSIGTSPNLLTNGGFEEGTAGWTGYHASLDSELTIVRSGAKSLKCTSTGNYSNADQSRYASLFYGLTCTLKAWAYIPSVNMYGSSLSIYVDASYIAGAGQSDIKDQWELRSVSAKLPASGTFLKFNLRNGGAESNEGDIYYFDDAEATVPQMRSRDAFARVCHPEGCLWTPQGFYFDGVDDLITFESDFIADSACTVMGWINVTLGANRWILDNGKFAFYIMGTYKCLGATSNGLFTQKYSAENSITEGKNTHVAVTRDATGLVNFYINGQPSGTPDQASGTPAAGTTNVVVGNRLAGDRPFKGTIDELMEINRVLSPIEIHNHYLLTRWKYQ